MEVPVVTMGVSPCGKWVLVSVHSWSRRLGDPGYPTATATATWCYWVFSLPEPQSQDHSDRETKSDESPGTKTRKHEHEINKDIKKEARR